MAPHLMMKVSVRRIGSTWVLAALLLSGGCKKHRKTTSMENTTDYAGNLQALVATKRLASLRWPDFSDYQAYGTQFYDDRDFEVAGARDGRPTAAAKGCLQALQDGGEK